jgi:hypothetical protein
LNPWVIVLITLIVVLIIMVLGAGLVIRKEWKRRRTIDLNSVGVGPDYVDTFFRGKKDPGLLERVLPSIGGSSGKKIADQIDTSSTGLDEDERAHLQGYLEMLDPDLMDDVTNSDIDSYDELGVSQKATNMEIRSAYLGYVRRYHPDKLIGKDPKLVQMAQEKLRKKNRAKAILLDPQKRALVDRMIRENESGRIRDLSVKSIAELRSLRRK